MAAVNEIQLSTELCTLASPALLAMDKMCLHYVIHYIKRSVVILSLFIEHFIAGEVSEFSDHSKKILHFFFLKPP